MDRMFRFGDGAPDSSPEESTSQELAAELDATVHLVERCKAGDDEALGQLLDRYYGRVLRILRVKMFSSLKRKIEPEEVLNSAMGVAIQKFPEFEYREPASLINWLTQIAMHKMRDKHKYFEAECRNSNLEVAIEAYGNRHSADRKGFEPSAKDTLPPDKIAREERRRVVDECIRELPESYQDVILHRAYEGGSWEYVGSKTDQTSGAARMEYTRAKLALSRMLKTRDI